MRLMIKFRMQGSDLTKRKVNHSTDRANFGLFRNHWNLVSLILFKCWQNDQFNFTKYHSKFNENRPIGSAARAKTSNKKWPILAFLGTTEILLVRFRYFFYVENDQFNLKSYHSKFSHNRPNGSAARVKKEYTKEGQF
uniref:Uncharacterized protein n=1 Tax=Cacopsylla melanoneura TaxID=428564 RepID=A0A8D8SIE4_9HEMI